MSAKACQSFAIAWDSSNSLAGVKRALYSEFCGDPYNANFSETEKLGDALRQPASRARAERIEGAVPSMMDWALQVTPCSLWIVRQS